MRHASFIPAGKRTLPRDSFPAPASIYSATQTPFIAGPLAAILGTPYTKQLLRKTA
jgi:hypothetical protein